VKDWLEVRPLDWRFLGQRLPGDPRKHQKLLELFKDILERNGMEWVTKNREMFLAGAKDILLYL
jgi:hypothetical protein